MTSSTQEESRVSPTSAGRFSMNDLPFMAEYISDLGTPDTLEEAIRQRDFWVEEAARFCRNEKYYRGLVVQCGEAIGDESYIADDGSRSQDVLCAKVPELVLKLVA